MTKIYNEIIIDMNPESSTFEKTIYEDSYEYEGDMMLARIYMGGAAMKGDASSDIRTLADIIEQQQKEFSEGMGWRNILSKGGDLFKTFFPGIGHAVSAGVDLIAQRNIDIGDPSKIREGQTMWTGGGYADEFGEMIAEANPSFLESILSQGVDYLGTEGGSDFLSEFKAREGGRVPKFKGGGLFKKFGKKKKNEVPEIPEELMALESILSGGYEKKLGKHKYPMGRTQSRDFTEEDGINLFRIISQFSTPEGDRYYPGEGTSRSHSLAQSKAMMDAASRAYHSPADSITTDQLAQLRELGLFKQEGGRVPKKYFGGGGVPTISDYFGKQGVSLGGSNKQSLAEKLGKR